MARNITVQVARSAIGTAIVASKDAKVAATAKRRAMGTATIVVAHMLAKGNEAALAKAMDTPEEQKLLNAIVNKRRDVLTIAGYGVLGTTVATDVKVQAAFNAFVKALGGVSTAKDPEAAKADMIAWLKKHPSAFEAAKVEWLRLSPEPVAKATPKVKAADQVKALTVTPFASLPLSQRRAIEAWMAGAKVAKPVAVANAA